MFELTDEEIKQLESGKSLIKDISGEREGSSFVLRVRIARYRDPRDLKRAQSDRYKRKHPEAAKRRHDRQVAIMETASDRHKRWTREAETELAVRIGRGEAISQIAQAMGRTYEGVKKKKKLLMNERV